RHLCLESRAVVPARSSCHGISCSRHLSRSQAEIPLIHPVQISRASSDVCVVSVSMSLNYPSSVELGSLTNTDKIVSVRALHEIWDRASVLTKVSSANESLMQWTQAAIDTLVADISQAKRDPDVVNARAVWPDRPMQTQKEYEQELESVLQKQ
ncbi:MAG: hypothetical protein O9352_23400, partial [Rhizobium sp.]|nr:hypothetical protein [Rhizobium sp.]